MTGLTRVRKFHQDDGHIFCTPSQIKQEISSSLEFIDRAYKALGFNSYNLTLSTRPESNYIGSCDEWENAERALKEALESTGKEWHIKQGDGAFYGPKIDVMIHDAIGRSHQTATIQLDFQLPTRFQLSFTDRQGNKGTPVMIHRAVLGSIERMMGILIENYAGKWPFWLSPRQVRIVTTRPELLNDAKRIGKELMEKRCDLFIDVDETDHSLPKQIREAQVLAYNYVLVVGDCEVENKTVTLRARDGTNMGEYTLESLVGYFDQQLDCKL